NRLRRHIESSRRVHRSFVHFLAAQSYLMNSSGRQGFLRAERFEIHRECHEGVETRWLICFLFGKIPRQGASTARCLRCDPGNHLNLPSAHCSNNWTLGLLSWFAIFWPFREPRVEPIAC